MESLGPGERIVMGAEISIKQPVEANFSQAHSQVGMKDTECEE